MGREADSVAGKIVIRRDILGKVLRLRMCSRVHEHADAEVMRQRQ